MTIIETKIKKQQSWIVLLLLCSSQFVVVLDTTVVNIALPAIQKALDFSQQNLQWVSNAYLLMFAGFLLLGGRVADILGRRKIFIVGMVLFALASLAGGFATSELWLILARVVQGIAAAIISPAALSIVTITFQEGQERDRALGSFGTMSGLGAVAGLVLGGVLTQFFGWQSVFFINMPIGLAVAILSLQYVEESRIEHTEQGFDVGGALSVTAGLVLLVYGLVQTGQEGWTSPWTLGAFGLSLALLSLFVIVELKSRFPMVNFAIFRYRRLTSANLITILYTACIGSTLFLLTLYMQQVLHYSALEAGLALLPFEMATVIAAPLSARLVTKFGSRVAIVTGLSLYTLGLFALSRVGVNNFYLTDLLPGTVLFGLGLTGSGIPLMITAVSGVPHQEVGLASGLLNTNQQIGNALGLAVLSTIAASVTASRATQVSSLEALADGFQVAFTVGAVIAFSALILTLALLRSGKPLKH